MKTNLFPIIVTVLVSLMVPPAAIDFSSIRNLDDPPARTTEPPAQIATQILDHQGDNFNLDSEDEQPQKLDKNFNPEMMTLDFGTALS